MKMYFACSNYDTGSSINPVKKKLLHDVWYTLKSLYVSDHHLNDIKQNLIHLLSFLEKCQAFEISQKYVRYNFKLSFYRISPLNHLYCLLSSNKCYF